MRGRRRKSSPKSAGLTNDLAPALGPAVAAGHMEAVQQTLCDVPRLFGEGKIGPDLTMANRKDRDFLLVSIVDPGVQVRKEYLVYAVETHDGRVVTGSIIEQNASSITLVGPKIRFGPRSAATRSRI